MFHFQEKEDVDGSLVEVLQEFSPNREFFQYFSQKMIKNLQYLGRDFDLNILLLPAYYFLHHQNYSKFTCPCCQDALARVLI